MNEAAHRHVNSSVWSVNDLVGFSRPLHGEEDRTAPDAMGCCAQQSAENDEHGRGSVIAMVHVGNTQIISNLLA